MKEEYSDYIDDILKAMAGMRDRLIHGYDVVDAEIIWITAAKTIPEILPLILKLR